MAPVIGWDETKPAGQDSLGLGDDEIRSLKTALRSGLDAEHVWPSVGGDAGVHRLGSARVFMGTQSLVSSSGTDGRLMVTSDSSALFHVGSAGTMLLGSRQAVLMGNDLVGGQRSYWAHEIGETLASIGGVTVVSIPNSGFSGIPTVVVSGESNGATSIAIMPVVIARTATSFTVASYDHSANFISGHTLLWSSFGTRTL